jgi:hypothetical protein
MPIFANFAVKCERMMEEGARADGGVARVMAA